MAETTRAPLITDDDVERWAREADLHVRFCDDPDVTACPACQRRLRVWRLGFEAAAPEMRARWVAEALDDVAAGLVLRYDTTPGGKSTFQGRECLEIADRVRALAAEYRDGKR